MKKTILLSIAALALAAGTAAARCGNCPGDKKAGDAGAAEAMPGKKHDCGDCPMRRKQGAGKCGGMTCPEKIKGAETVSRNTGSGVEVTTTARDKETVAQIQELSMVHYGPKAGKCPGCPAAVPGAETTVTNIENGVRVLITGKTPEAVRKIQKASAGDRAARQSAKSAMAVKKRTCASKCAEAGKPCKCPGCGMPAEETK